MSYVIAAYVIVGALVGGYALSIFLRWRGVEQASGAEAREGPGAEGDGTWVTRSDRAAVDPRPPSDAEEAGA